MTFEQTWTYVMGDDIDPDLEAVKRLKELAYAFYVAGQTRGIEEARGVVRAANEPDHREITH